MEAVSENDFRKDNVLYSFEDIFTGLGIEEVDVSHENFKKTTYSQKLINKVEKIFHFFCFIEIVPEGNSVL